MDLYFSFSLVLNQLFTMDICKKKKRESKERGKRRKEGQRGERERERERERESRCLSRGGVAILFRAIYDSAKNASSGHRAVNKLRGFGPELQAPGAKDRHAWPSVAHTSK